MTTFAKELAERTRPVKVSDSHGNTSDDYDSPDPVAIGAVLFAPAGPREGRGDREHEVRFAGTVYAKPGIDIRPGDAVTVRGIRHLVLGEPQQWQIGTVIELEHWEG